MEKHPDIAFYFCFAPCKNQCGSRPDFGISWGTVWKICAACAEHGQSGWGISRSPTEVIPGRCCPCIFLLVGVAKKKRFSVSLERGNNALLFRHYAVHSLSTHNLQFSHKLIVIRWNPSWTGDGGEYGAKNRPQSPPAFFLFHQQQGFQERQSRRCRSRRVRSSSFLHHFQLARGSESIISYTASSLRKAGAGQRI